MKTKLFIALGVAAVLVIEEPDLAVVPPTDRERLREIGRSGKYRVFEEK